MARRRSRLPCRLARRLPLYPSEDRLVELGDLVTTEDVGHVLCLDYLHMRRLHRLQLCVDLLVVNSAASIHDHAGDEACLARMQRRVGHADVEGEATDVHMGHTSRLELLEHARRLQL